MQIIVIACHYQTGRNKEPNGFRLMDLSTGQIKDVPYEALRQVMISKQADIVNVEIDGAKLKGSNGTFDRYSKIVNGKLRGEAKMVVLKELGTVGYEVCDHTGKIGRAHV